MARTNTFKVYVKTDCLASLICYFVLMNPGIKYHIAGYIGSNLV